MTTKHGSCRVCSTDSNGLVGTIADRDITIRMVAEGIPNEIPVEHLITGAPLFCHAGEDLSKAHELKNCRRC